MPAKSYLMKSLSTPVDPPLAAVHFAEPPSGGLARRDNRHPGFGARRLQSDDLLQYPAAPWDSVRLDQDDDVRLITSLW